MSPQRLVFLLFVDVCAYKYWILHFMLILQCRKACHYSEDSFLTGLDCEDQNRLPVYTGSWEWQQVFSHTIYSIRVFSTWDFESISSDYTRSFCSATGCLQWLRMTSKTLWVAMDGHHIRKCQEIPTSAYDCFQYLDSASLQHPRFEAGNQPPHMGPQMVVNLVVSIPSSGTPAGWGYTIYGKSHK